MFLIYDLVSEPIYTRASLIALCKACSVNDRHKWCDETLLVSPPPLPGNGPETVLRTIRPWCIIHQPPYLVKSYVGRYLDIYIVSTHLLPWDCSLYCTKQQRQQASRWLFFFLKPLGCLLLKCLLQNVDCLQVPSILALHHWRRHTLSALIASITTFPL